MWLYLALLIGIPAVLTIWNIVTFLVYAIRKSEKKSTRFIEIAAMLAGTLFLCLYMNLRDIALVPWHSQLYNNQTHSMVEPEAFPTILTFLILAFSGYLYIRFVPAKKQPPLLSAFGIVASYVGIIVCAVWCIQTSKDLILMLFPANCILIFMKAVFILVHEKNRLVQDHEVSLKFKKISEFLNKATNLPWAALLLLFPTVGLIVAILFLFGQEPNSIIKAWTETADWTLSQKIGPQNVQYDEHYLCTVAAGGHRKVVKPFRTGIRHGHKVLVNRQLCVANAFEQVLEERAPNIHRVIRGLYDRTGYPISRHIHSKFLADAIYFIMKPLEWMFLMVLYSVDTNPEDRIAIQYPHAKKPEGCK